MNLLERIAKNIRHSRILANNKRLWDLTRPIYDQLIGNFSKKGLSRTINRTDVMRVSPKFRGVPESYEPEVWSLLMGSLRENDTVVDVGAFIGLYAISIAKRLGADGHVIAFEPDAVNHQDLIEHVRMNGVDNKIRVIKAACGSRKERLAFTSQNIQSHLSSAAESSGSETWVECVTLDDVFSSDRIDILKIDVEGYEEHVLKGASRILSDTQRKPRIMFIEVHPYAWKELGTTSASLLLLLRSAGYQVSWLDSKPVNEIVSYGEIIAILENSDPSFNFFSGVL